jgi:hypothetical protein
MQDINKLMHAIQGILLVQPSWILRNYLAGMLRKMAIRSLLELR